MNINVATTKRECWCRGTCPKMAAVRELQRERPRRAVIELRRVLIDAPTCPEAHRALAQVLMASNCAAAAGEHLEKARDVIGLTPDLALQIAANLRGQAKIPEAIEAAAHALLLNEENVVAYVVLATVLQADGRLDQAQLVIDDADRRFPKAVQMRRMAALVLGDRKDYQAAIARLQGDDLTPIELFDRGRFHEALGQYEAAWRDWMAAKQIQREKENCIYDAAQDAQAFAELLEVSRPPRLNYLRGCDQPARRPWPIFITGFPRSGTTMVEAAISAHPSIVAGDELAFLNEVVQRMPAWLNVRVPYPRALMGTAFPENKVIPALMRDYYIGKSVQKIGDDRAAGKLYFTDKMPSNEMHWLLISLLFPETPILHVRRHPLDIMISNMSHSLVHGRFNACSLEWCAMHYALTDNLVDHYRRKMPSLKLHEIRYESFVADHHAAIDAALPKDLKPDQACYDFHLNPWHSRTISHRQIKEPVHDRSVGRYKPFLDFLRPIVPMIQQTLDREGYEL